MTQRILDANLVAETGRLTGTDEALHCPTQLEEQANIRDLRGRLHWEGDLVMLRETRVMPDEIDNAIHGLNRRQ